MDADINDWNDRIIAEFRANAGYVAWSSDDDLAAGRPVPPRLVAFDERQGVPIILVHHTGAKSGLARVSPMLYQPVDAGFAVFASSGGSPRHPDWYRNLVAHPQATVEVGRDKTPVVARRTVGTERERIWTRQVTLVPAFAEFEVTAGRQIPVVVLERAHEQTALPGR